VRFAVRQALNVKNKETLGRVEMKKSLGCRAEQQSVACLAARAVLLALFMSDNAHGDEVAAGETA